MPIFPVILFDSGIIILQSGSDFALLKQYDRLKALEHTSVVPSEIRDILHNLRKSGNKGSHAGEANGAEARFMLRKAFYLSVWFYEFYEEKDIDLEFTMPSKDSNHSYILEKVKEELESTKEELESFKLKAISYQVVSEKQKEERKERKGNSEDYFDPLNTDPCMRDCRSKFYHVFKRVNYYFINDKGFYI